MGPLTKQREGDEQDGKAKVGGTTQACAARHSPESGASDAG